MASSLIWNEKTKIIFLLFFVSVGEPQISPTNLAVTVTVSGVAALAIICATAYLVVRSCSKRRQHGDLNVAT